MTQTLRLIASLAVIISLSIALERMYRRRNHQIRSRRRIARHAVRPHDELRLTNL